MGAPVFSEVLCDEKKAERVVVVRARRNLRKFWAGLMGAAFLGALWLTAAIFVCAPPAVDFRLMVLLISVLSGSVSGMLAFVAGFALAVPAKSPQKETSEA